MQTTLEEALGNIAESSPMKEPKHFVVRTWVRNSITPETPQPIPACWVMRAVNHTEAHKRSFYTRFVLESAYTLMRSGQHDEGQFLISTICEHVHLMEVDEATIVLGDIGIPVEYLPDFHVLDEVAVIPFTEATGFSPEILVERIANIPTQVTDNEVNS